MLAHAPHWRSNVQDKLAGAISEIAREPRV